MNWLDRTIGFVAPARRCAAPGSGRRSPCSPAATRARARPPHRRLGRRRHRRQRRDRHGARPAARPLARSRPQQPLRRQGGAGAGQQHGRHRPPAAGAIRRCRRQRDGRQALGRLRRDLRRRRAHRLLRPAGADRPRLAESGECLVRLRERRVEDGLPVPLQLQVLEPDHLDASKTGDLPNGGFVLQGVEFDALGRRRAYWLYPGASRRGGDVPPGVADQPAGAGVDRCCTCSTGCGRGRCAACRGSRR